MNPHLNKPNSPIYFCKILWVHFSLIKKMAWRDIIGRYKGSLMGIIWSIAHPILMLLVYTFIFSVVFKARWGIEGESNSTFALILFTGLIMHGLLAEVLNRAPSLITGNVNYVKKVVFPLEILPLVSLISAVFQSIVSLSVLLLASVILNGYLHWTLIFIPVVIFPLAILTLGISFLLSSLGVYIRDINQAIGILTTIMLFISPIFFPISILPEKFHIYLYANPITFIVQQAREVLLFGNHPDWIGLGKYMLISSVIFWIGYSWFQKTRRGFADVI